MAFSVAKQRGMAMRDGAEAAKQVADMLLYRVQCGDVVASEDALGTFLRQLSADPSFHRFVDMF